MTQTDSLAPLFDHPLETEDRAGVPHFKPEQHKAWIVTGCTDYASGDRYDLGRISYVDVMGHHCVILAMRKTADDPWQATWLGRVGQATSDTRRAPKGFMLSNKMLAALDAATILTAEEIT